MKGKIEVECTFKNIEVGVNIVRKTPYQVRPSKVGLYQVKISNG